MAGKATGDRRKPRKGAKNAAPAKAIRVGVIDYKDVATLRKFISERGKIRARRITGVSVQEQRLIAKAIKNAREMALLPEGVLHPMQESFAKLLGGQVGHNGGPPLDN